MAPFYILCECSKQVLDIKGGSREHGTELITYPFHGGPNQLWEYRDGMIWSMNNEGHVIDIDMTNNKIIMYPSHGGPNQKWTFNDDGSIVSGTGKVMDVCGSSTGNGTAIIPYGKTGNSNQCFRVVFV